MKHPLKSLLALLLALCMSMSLLAAGVWAADVSDPASEDLSVQEELTEEEEEPSDPETQSFTEDVSAAEEEGADAEDACAEDEAQDEDSTAAPDEEAPDEEAQEPGAGDAEAPDEEQPEENLTAQDPDVSYSSLTFTFSGGTVGTEIGDPIPTNASAFTETSGHATLASIKWYKQSGSDWLEQTGTFTAGTWHCFLGFSSGSLANSINVNLAGFASAFGDPHGGGMNIYYTSSNFTISEPTGLHNATTLTVTSNIDQIGLKWATPSTISLITTEKLILQSRLKGDGGWTTVFQRSGGSDVRDTKSAQSGVGSWDTLPLISGKTYQFRVYYVDKFGNPGTAATAETTYYCKSQDQATLKQRIQNYLTVGLSASEGKNMVYKSAYDEKGLTANKTELFYNRPLYQLDVKFTGTSVGTGLDQGDTMLNFSATYASRVRSNGFQQGDARYVDGLDFRLEGLWYLNKNGTEQYQSLSESANKQNFTVNLSKMGSGCNYIKLRLICYGYNTYGVDQYWVEEPIYFNVGFSATPLNTYSALTTKNAITLKPCTNYGGTLSYDSALPTAKGNVRAIGMTVWYRKKGTSQWTAKPFSGTKPPVITGLKPDTVYQWKAQYYITSKDHTGAIQTVSAPETAVFTVCTAVSKKPKVKSCKVSKVKVKKHTIKAHWQKTGTFKWSWIKKQVWYTTDFKVTYTFANASRNIKGYTSGGVYAPVKKGKVTFSMSVNTGKKKAKAKKFSTKLRACTNTNGPGVDVSGLSPTLKYKGKIK